MPSWIEDFRRDVEAVRESGKPAFILHGTADRILPIDATARPLRDLLRGASLMRVLHPLVEWSVQNEE
ncbi:hypothetical protein ABZ863_18825 [Saccharomonospora sp. NPDC046836]|uniref:hypothetical protein n=1 Tax=Saccharomonospora sp. NPDC046836 TaxID=3156921 RepID=UPI0033D7C0A3